MRDQTKNFVIAWPSRASYTRQRRSSCRRDAPEWDCADVVAAFISPSSTLLLAFFDLLLQA